MGGARPACPAGGPDVDGGVDGGRDVAAVGGALGGAVAVSSPSGRFEAVSSWL